MNHLRILILPALAAFLFSSCASTDTPKKDHDYGLDNEDADVTGLPWNRPSEFESNPNGSFPQSR